MPLTEFLDPPAEPLEQIQEDSVLKKMFEALLDPRSIQWMLMLGGGLLVLGLVVLLINWLDIEAPYIIAASMGAGTLAIMAGGWYFALKTKYKIAGRALTFLTCVVAPLNLWYYHAQDILTLENHLWVGGVICSLLYIATVRVLRDPIFMYAVAVGVTLTVLLFLPVLNVSVDATNLSITLMILGLVAVHAERAFTADEGEFSRARYGMPLFWSGQAQAGAALLILLSSQLLSWLHEPLMRFFDVGFQGNLLTDKPVLAGGIWLLGTYLYLYSDFVVRKVGVYIYLAAISLLMAIISIIGWQFESPEAVIFALTLVALGANIARRFTTQLEGNLSRVTAPLGLILNGLPLLIGWVLLLRANYNEGDPSVPIQWNYIFAMLAVTVSNRISAHLFRLESIKHVTTYLSFSAAALLMAAAGLLPLVGFELWYQQAPLLMVIPIGYMVAARLWRGQVFERPLGWIGHAATAIILFHAFVGSLNQFSLIMQPVQEHIQNLLLGAVFAEASLFYALAGLFRKRSVNAYFAAAAACGALWQWMGYFGVAGYLHTILYAVLGLVTLITARKLGLEKVDVFLASGEPGSATRGRGATAFQCGNAILSIALLSAFWQGFMRLFDGSTPGVENFALLVTTVVSVAAIWTVPWGTWRQVYTSASILLALLSFLTLSIEWLRKLNLGEKIELVCVIAGVALLVVSYVGRFREKDGSKNELVGTGLFLGSVLAAVPLLIAVVYHRWGADIISFRDELGILAVTIVMLVTGYSWQAKSPTLIGGGCLTLYLIVLITELARRAEQMMGVAVFMTIAGAAVFGIGIALSMYREKLLELPDKISNREGLFRVISWR